MTLLTSEMAWGKRNGFQDSSVQREISRHSKHGNRVLLVGSGTAVFKRSKVKGRLEFFFFRPRIKHGVLHLLGKYATLEPHLQPKNVTFGCIDLNKMTAQLHVCNNYLWNFCFDFYSFKCSCVYCVCEHVFEGTHVWMPTNVYMKPRGWCQLSCSVAFYLGFETVLN